MAIGKTREITVSDISKKYQAEIDGLKVAEILLEFMREFRGTYDMATVGLCGVGPLQSMIGFAIAKGYLRLPDNNGE